MRKIMCSSELKATAAQFSESTEAIVDPTVAGHEWWEDCYPAGLVVRKR